MEIVGHLVEIVRHYVLEFKNSCFRFLSENLVGPSKNGGARTRKKTNNFHKKTNNFHKNAQEFFRDPNHQISIFLCQENPTRNCLGMMRTISCFAEEFPSPGAGRNPSSSSSSQTGPIHATPCSCQLVPGNILGMMMNLNGASQHLFYYQDYKCTPCLEDLDGDTMHFFHRIWILQLVGGVVSHGERIIMSESSEWRTPS